MNPIVRSDIFDRFTTSTCYDLHVYDCCDNDTDDDTDSEEETSKRKQALDLEVFSNKKRALALTPVAMAAVSPLRVAPAEAPVASAAASPLAVAPAEAPAATLARAATAWPWRILQPRTFLSPAGVQGGGIRVFFQAK